MCDILEELDVQLDDDESAVFEKVAALFAPHTSVEAHYRLSSIRMRDQELSLQAVLDYSRRYARLSRLCTQEVLPAPHRLCALHVAGLRPIRLALAVSLREPTSLAEARKYAVEKVSKLVEVLRLVAELGQKAVGSSKGTLAGSFTGPRQ